MGLLPNTTLLPLEHMVKYRSVCTQHVLWLESTQHFLWPRFLRWQLQRWWSTIVRGGDIDITFLLSLLLNRNPALISANSVTALEHSVNRMYCELLLHGQETASKCMPQISGMVWLTSDSLSTVTPQQVAWKGLVLVWVRRELILFSDFAYQLSLF